MRTLPRSFSRTAIVALTLLSTSLTFAQEDPKKKLVPAEKGRKAPDFVATNEKGKPFKLSDFMKKKKDKNVVLIFSRGNW